MFEWILIPLLLFGILSYVWTQQWIPLPQMRPV